MREYRLTTRNEKIGRLDFTIESLASLDETIDDLFAQLEREGNPELLESLCPYFGVVWPAARALSEVLVEKGSERLAGRRLLEVGCGLALPSLVAARLGAGVVATDCHPDIPRFLESNLNANGLVGCLDYREGDWRQPNVELGSFDWVVGSDILYERQHPEPVAQMLSNRLAPGGTVILADPGRPYVQPFADEMKRLGYSSEVQIRNGEVFVIEFFRPEDQSGARIPKTPRS